LDHTFSGKLTSCLVNPRACHESEVEITPTDAPKSIAVVGAGPAGLSISITAAQRGHKVTLFDRADEVGGQLNIAKQVPGKEEFFGLVDWFKTMTGEAGVSLRLGHEATPEDLTDFDEVVIATGVLPRDPEINGQDGANVLSYIDVLKHGAPVGEKVVIVGAGGIGFDVAEFLAESGESLAEDTDAWRREWGVGDPEETRGGLAPAGAEPQPSAREIVLLQRKAEKLGKRLGKTTGWIHRATLQMKNVQMIGGVNYEAITPEGLQVSYGAARERPEILKCDTVVLCAGQVPERSLADALIARGKTVHVIGGADVAAELDAKRAIDQGTRLACAL
jgi:2,4-dienoyl-CoA reductase (NADPH2)